MKDTPRNVLDTGEFSVSVVVAEATERMDHTAADPADDSDEFELAGIPRASCERVDAPYVADSPITMECELADSQEIAGRTMIVGDVVHFRVAEDAMRDGQVDSREITTVGRLGGPYYTHATPVSFERRY